MCMWRARELVYLPLRTVAHRELDPTDEWKLGRLLRMWTEPYKLRGGRKPRVQQLVSLLCVPLVAASSCPDSYLASGSACYRVTTETAPHWGCDALCGLGASLACIRSVESELLADPASNAWLGPWKRAR